MPECPATDRGRFSDEAGISLIEVMIAIFLLATAMMALAHVATSGLWSLRATTDRTTAVSLATRAVEAARHLNYEELSLDAPALPDACAATTFDVTDDLTEDVRCSSTGGVGSDLPYWGADGVYEIETWVTEIDGFPNARRVTAVVAFDERGRRDHEVRTSTVIARVDRD